jgi:hypothetical protein
MIPTLSGCPVLLPLCVFLIGVICSCQEIYTTKACSVVRDVNMVHKDPSLVDGGEGVRRSPPRLVDVLNQVCYDSKGTRSWFRRA